MFKYKLLHSINFGSILFCLRLIATLLLFLFLLFRRAFTGSRGGVFGRSFLFFIYFDFIWEETFYILTPIKSVHTKEQQRLDQFEAPDEIFVLFICGIICFWQIFVTRYIFLKAIENIFRLQNVHGFKTVWELNVFFSENRS